MEKRIGTENGKDKTKEQAGNDGEDFHVAMLSATPWNSNHNARKFNEKRPETSRFSCLQAAPARTRLGRSVRK